MGYAEKTREVKSAQLSNGLQLPYVEQGLASGIPVVFVHAYVESWRYFEHLLAELPAEIHAFVPTQRGHGDADHPASGYRLEDFSRDVAAFMDAVALDTAVIAGSSSGGYVAQRFAIDYPARTLGVALIGAPRDLHDKPGVSEFLASMPPTIDAAFARTFLDSTLARPLPRQLADVLVEESCKAPARVWKDALAGLIEAAPPTETGTIAAPTLILWGDRDEFLPRSEEDDLARAIPGSRLVVYEGTGHAVLLEEPQRVASDIVAFATTLP